MKKTSKPAGRRSRRFTPFATCLLLLATLSAHGTLPSESRSSGRESAPTNSEENDQSGLMSAATVVVPPAPPLQIVTCAEGTDLDALVAEFQLSPRSVLRGIRIIVAPMDAATIAKLQGDDRILYVEADGPVTLCMQTNSTGIVRMGVDQFPVARINGITEPLDVDVAVLDTGIDPHPDLNVFHFWSPFTTNPNDELRHGTGVAGVIGALDNHFGVVGVAPGVRLWNIKVFNPSGIDWSDALVGMDYCYEHADQISVANMSFGNAGTAAPINSIRAVVRDMVRAGIVVVAGAGNFTNDLAGADGVFGTGDDVLPAALPEAMAVSGMQPTNDIFWPPSTFNQIPRTNTTNYVVSPGGAIDVTAPAFQILTTDTNGGYRIASGTSYAAPHVAGLVALYIAANGRATNAEGVFRIRQAIVDAGLPQSQWNTANTFDPDTNPEPLAIASEAWIPKPFLTNSGAPGNFQLSFATVPGYDYTVQSTTNLTPPIVWTNLATVTDSSNVVPANVTDTSIAPESFYRLSRQSALGRLQGQLQLLTNPQSRTNLVGTIATMNVTVFGETPAYFWHKDGTPLTDGGKISGATTAELTVTGVQSTDAGGYSVVATNGYGSVTSAVATLTIQSTVLVTGVSATATSEITPFNRVAANAVNGIYFDNSFWQSVGVNSPWGNDPSPAITFDLGAVRPVEKAEIWNGHEAGPSIKRMLVETSSDGVSFSPLDEFTLSTISPASELLAFGRVACRYIRFTILENGDGQIFPVVGPPTSGTHAAIDEVEFHEYLPD